MRVATFYFQQQNLARLQESTSKLSFISYQASSGLKAQRFEDMAQEATQLFNLQEVRNNNDIYISGLTNAQSRLTAMEDALNSITDLLVDATNVYTLGRNELSADVRATIAPKAQGLADTFAQLFNTQYEGRYLFSGQASNVPPLTTALTGNPFPGDPPPTTYYNGDTELQRVLTSPGVDTTYGVAGDNIGFARIKAGLEALIFGLQNDSETDLDGAIDLLRQAQSDVSDMLGDIGGDLAGFQQLQDRFESSNNFMNQRIAELQEVDIAEASTRFAQEEAALNASMSVTGRLLNISLLNFL